MTMDLNMISFLKQDVGRMTNVSLVFPEPAVSEVRAATILPTEGDSYACHVARGCLGLWKIAIGKTALSEPATPRCLVQFPPMHDGDA